MIVKQLEISKINIPDNRLRKAKTEYVMLIAEDIQNNGQQQPITVHDTGDGTYTLIAGLHRVHAIKELKQNNIWAVVYPTDTPQSTLRLMEVGENLARHELDTYIKLKFIAEQKKIWRITSAGHGGDRKTDSFQVCSVAHLKSFTEEMKEKTGLGERAIRIAELIIEALIPYDSIMQDLPCPVTVTDLRKLAQLPQDKIKTVLRYVQDAYEYPKDTDNRLQNLSFAIKAVNSPEAIHPR